MISHSLVNNRKHTEKVKPTQLPNTGYTICQVAMPRRRKPKREPARAKLARGRSRALHGGVFRTGGHHVHGEQMLPPPLNARNSAGCSLSDGRSLVVHCITAGCSPHYHRMRFYCRKSANQHGGFSQLFYKKTMPSVVPHRSDVHWRRRREAHSRYSKVVVRRIR